MGVTTKYNFIVNIANPKTPNIIYYITGHDTAISIRPAID